MTKLLLMSDDQDEELGCFFSECSEKVKYHFLESSLGDAKLLKSKHLQNNIAFDCYVNSLEDTNFICGAFMHGTEDELCCGENVIITQNDSSKFKNAVAYFCVCKTGKSLLGSIVENGAHAAVGYKEDFYVQKFFNKKSIFVNCAISLFTHFFSNQTLSDSINKMKQEYTNAIDNIYEEDPFAAALLLSNRDSIVFYGKTNINISSF